MLVALYAQDPNQSMGLDQGVTYIWFTQMLLTFIAWGPDPIMSAMIREGSLAYELIRPLRLSIFWYMRSLAFRGINPLMRGLPILLIASLLPAPLKITWPPFSFAWLSLVILSLLVAWLLASALNNLINIGVLWFMSDEGLVRLAPIVMFFFGGLILPIPLFPEVLQPLLRATPFVGLMELPARIFSGHMWGQEALFALGIQSLWWLSILFLNDFILERRLKSAVIQGG